MSPTEQSTPPAHVEDSTPNRLRRAFGLAVAAAVFAVPAMAAANPGLVPGISVDRAASHRADVTDVRGGAPSDDATDDEDLETSAETDDGAADTDNSVSGAGEADEPGTDEPGTDEPGTDETGADESGTDEKGAEESGAEEPAAEDARPSPDARPEHRPRLSCAPNRTEDGVAIGCKWTAVGDDRADGYRLLRSVDDEARGVIFRTDDNRQNGYRDLVKPGHTYRYAVQYVDAAGSVVFTSNAEHIRLPAPSDTPVLRCEAHRGDSSPVIGCQWTPASEDRADGYRLLRAVDDSEREVVYRTDDNRANAFKQAVRRGHTYRYAVQYVSADGAVVATSDTFTIELPAAPADVEKLRLACEQTQPATADQRAVVACKWSAATADSVVGYKLIRRDADGREVVARGGAEFLAHRETVAPGRYGYRVVGVDGDGAVVAASESVVVRVSRPADKPTDTEPHERPTEAEPTERSGDEADTSVDRPSDKPSDRRAGGTTTSSANR